MRSYEGINNLMIRNFYMAGKFGAVFASIPFPIFAALYCVLFGLVGAFDNLDFKFSVLLNK